MKASVLATTIVLAGCANGLMLADAPVTLDPKTTASDPTATTSTRVGDDLNGIESRKSVGGTVGQG